ncbi:MAG: metallophosphoesterase [Candidatus Nanoarchaeia archaeon]
MTFRRKLASLGVATSLLLSGVNCTKSSDLETKVDQTPSIRTINNQQFRFEGERVKQLSEDPDHQAKYGIISDAHGEAERARFLAKQFKEKGVEGIILPGDIPKNEQLRYGRKDTQKDQEEIENVLRAVAETALPILVIPGNHERREDYENAIAKVSKQYGNIIDMSKVRVYDGDDVDFVSLPGYSTFKAGGRQFIPNDGYWIKSDAIKATGKLREGLEDAVVLISHGAPKTSAKKGPGTLYSGQDVGDEAITRLMKEYNIPFAVVGHIHEAGVSLQHMKANRFYPENGVSNSQQTSVH